MAKRKQTATERAQDEADRALLVQNALRTRRLAEKAQAELDAKEAERRNGAKGVYTSKVSDTSSGAVEVPGEQPLALGVDLAASTRR